MVKPPKDRMKDIDTRVTRMKDCVFSQTTKRPYATIKATKIGCVSSQATKRPFVGF